MVINICLLSTKTYTYYGERIALPFFMRVENFCWNITKIVVGCVHITSWL